MNTYHQPVMLNESLKYLNVRDNCVYVDCTLGGGGHSEAILEANQTALLYAFDQDNDALEFAHNRLLKFGDRIKMFKANFSHFRSILALNKIKQIDGILFDLGVSSHQIDATERGFSYLHSCNLDMRMDQSLPIDAKDVINTLSESELSFIIKEYGEELYAKKISQSICNERTKKAITDTQQLLSIIRSVIKGSHFDQLKSAARVFQAIRIYVNDELESIKTALSDAINLLKPNGTVVVISYHSLEDRIVKNEFKSASGNCLCPPQALQCQCNNLKRIKIVTSRPVLPTAIETKTNPRSRSAKLRAAIKLGGKDER